MNMFPVYIRPGLRFKLGETVYQILKRLSNATVEVFDEQFNDTKIFTHKELIKYLSDGSLKFETKGKNVIQDIKSSINTSFSFDDIENLKHKERAIFRYEVIKPLLLIPYPKRKFSNIEKRVNEVKSWADNPKLIQENLNCRTFYVISKTSVYRWIQDYELSGGDFRSLIPNYQSSGGKDRPRIDLKIIEFINQEINTAFLNKQRITIKELRSIVYNRISEHNLYSENKLECPPESTFARYISKIPEFELIAKRIGKRIAGHKFDPVGQGVVVKYPLERVEIDHTPIDVLLVNDKGVTIGRPYLILAIDKLTRHILGFSIGLSNGVGWTEVMDCIKHIITDKSYIKDMYPFIKNEWTAFGVPKTIVVDNGLEFKNNAMKDACYQLGFFLQFCPPRVPQWKGSIERFFGTSNTGLFHTLPGTTRSKPGDLGDENPSKTAKLTFPAFLALVHKWIVDVYSQDINRGAGGIPSKLWEAALDDHPVAWPNSTSEIAILLGKTCLRQINRRGIELDSLRYNSHELNKLFIKFTAENNGKYEDFKVKYDPQNIGEIYVYDHIVDKHWIKVPCVNQEYANNLSEWEHKEAKSYAKREFGTVDEEALAKAKLCIRNMIANGMGYTEKQIARANKVNSDSEITKSMNSQQNKQDSCTVTYNQCTSNPNFISISETGQTLTDNSIIIPEMLSLQVESDQANKVIDINKKKHHSGQKSTKKQTPHDSDEQEQNIVNNDLNFDDFSGFSITTNFTEVNIDGRISE